MSIPINPAMLQKLKKSRMIPDVLDYTKVKTVTPEIFWSELDTKVELNFERPSIRKKALEDGLSFDVILPGSVSHLMYIEVFFDEEGSIVTVNFDPGNSIHDNLCEMLYRTKIRSDIELGTT
jgi:hypothetical protein